MTNKNLKTWRDEFRIRAEKGMDADGILSDSAEKLEKAGWHPYPWMWGTWVSIPEGIVYVGHGGNERETAHWFERGPWVLLPDDALEFITEPLMEAAEEAKSKTRELVEQIALLAQRAGISLEEN